MCSNQTTGSYVPPMPTLKVGENRPYREIWVGQVDLLEVVAEIRTLRATVRALVEDVQELQEQVVAMWMAPGMPGARAAKTHFEALAWQTPNQ